MPRPVHTRYPRLRNGRPKKRDGATGMRSKGAGGERQKRNTAGPGRAEAQGESSERSEEKEGSGNAAEGKERHGETNPGPREVRRAGPASPLPSGHPGAEPAGPGAAQTLL